MFKRYLAVFGVVALAVSVGLVVTSATANASTLTVAVSATPTASTDTVDPAAPAAAPHALLAAPSNCIGQKICFYAESLGRGAVNLVNTTGCQNFPANWNDAVTSIWNTYNTGSYVVHVYMDSNCLTPGGTDQAKSLFPQDDVQLNNEWWSSFKASGFDDQITSFKICAMPCSA